jgi:transposase InsO family protein
VRLAGQRIRSRLLPRRKQPSELGSARAAAFIIRIVACDLRPKFARAVFVDLGLVGSMGRRGNPHDNPKAESLMKRLKV